MKANNQALSSEALENLNNFLEALVRLKASRQANDKKDLKGKESLENILIDMQKQMPPKFLEEILIQKSDELSSKINKVFVEAMYDYIDCESAEKSHQEYIAGGSKSITHDALMRKHNVGQ